jgi:hypothetical protein
MFGLRTRNGTGAVQRGVVLDLSGPKLRRAFEHLLAAAEPTGGIERYVGALALKASLFEEVLRPRQGRRNERSGISRHRAFVAPARRRVGAWLAENGFRKMHRLAALLDGWSDTATADFAACRVRGRSFPANRANRWVRDLAAEALHLRRPNITR